ncbi:FAD-dependent oxidoreductase [Mitsuokella sp. WILCCON 0060]|uniref:FAD-dependent oxidoreductase n=1 Tax=unclassified Mitsuokella TaxID=2637239 RepID=UPI003F10B6CF
MPAKDGELYDVIVIGGGPAGLTAAIYLARACYRVLVVEKEHFGGQLTITERVVNYPGIASISGAALTEHMRQQAEAFGAEFKLATVTSLDMTGDIKTVNTSQGPLKCFGVLLAAGARPRSAGFKGEDEFRGRGVAYCATCDGEFFRDLPVFVIGGGYAAAEESVFLTKYASHVTCLVRGDDFSCAEQTAEEAKENPNITVLTNTVVEAAEGDSMLRSLTYKNTRTGEVKTYTAPEGKTFGLFVFAGYEPATELVKGIAARNDKGYVITDENMKTTCDGLYAAGDIRIKSLRQCITAAGDGALAATELERYALAMQKKTGIRPLRPAAEKKEAPAAKDAAAAPAASASGLFQPEIVAQLQTVFARMEHPLELRLFLDDSAASQELAAYMKELRSLTDKLQVTRAAADEDAGEKPCVRVYRQDKSFAGLAFHGVPGGHEFTSFVLGLYNASGKGQAVEENLRQQILAFDKPCHLRIFVSLSCTMCPELVTAAQRMATLNSKITTGVYDLNRYPDLQKKYQVMSVPCFFINDSGPEFGKKNIAQLFNMISQS